jgi:antitoxin component YwqK of YwqJK toxin-antitoxin module
MMKANAKKFKRCFSTVLTLCLTFTLSALVASETKTVTVESLKDLPERLQHNRSLKKHFKKYTNEEDESPKFEVTIGYYFDQGQTNSTNQFEPFCKAIVPLNEKGEAHGTKLTFGKPHRVSKKTEYKNGKKHGVEQFVRRGRLLAEIPWVEGKIHGTKKKFYPAKEPIVRMTAEYKNDKQHGEVKNFTRDGKLISREHMKNGDRNGKRIIYYEETGNPKRIIEYKDSVPVGTVKEFFETGELKKTIAMENGRFHGPQVEYNKEGEVVDEEFYLNGTKVSKFEYNQAEKKQ